MVEMGAARKFSICVLVLAFLMGCGSQQESKQTVTTPTAPAAPTPSLASVFNGNWGFFLYSNSSVLMFNGGGVMTSSGSAVSGTIFLVGSSHTDGSTSVPNCFVTQQNGGGVLDPIPVNGTVASDGSLKLTSSPVAGQVLTMTGTVSNNNMNGTNSTGAVDNFNPGTYTVTGGCDDGDSGSAIAWGASTLNGAYSGQFFSSSNDETLNVSVTIAQSAFANANGFYSASGAATFSNSPCFASGSFGPNTPPNAAQLIFGDYVQVQIVTNTGATVLFQGTADASGKTISGTYQVMGGVCSGDSGKGAVYLQ